MEKSQSIQNISAALLKFHGSMGKIKKEAKNPFFKSKYATLSNIQDAIAAHLQDAGLTYAQFPEGNGLTTILMHPESGEYLQSTSEMKPVKDDPQSKGSAITYERRYALGAILGLNIDDDDDGNKASQPKVSSPLDIPCEEDKQLLRSLVYSSTLDEDKQQEALDAINACQSYANYDKLKYRLEDLQPSIDQIPNPSQKDITTHVKKLAGNAKG